nr:MAG TPA: hypothetical protein [Caudoviricetes sp.]
MLPTKKALSAPLIYPSIKTINLITPLIKKPLYTYYRSVKK